MMHACVRALEGALSQLIGMRLPACSKGKAVLWYSVRTSDLAMDPLADHEAQPVTKGIK